MKEIIEDTVSRDKEFQESRRQRAKIMRESGAPDVLVEYEEMASKMTVAEYQIFCKKLEEQQKQENLEHAKNNTIQQSIVDEIYRRESELEYEPLLYSSGVCLVTAIDPLGFMSEDDYYHDLYRAFLDHAKEIYRERFKEQYEAEE